MESPLVETQEPSMNDSHGDVAEGADAHESDTDELAHLPTTGGGGNDEEPLTSGESNDEDCDMRAPLIIDLQEEPVHEGR